MAKEKHKRGNKKSGGGRTNELNRRKKKFSTGGGRDDLREARTSENRSRFLLQFYDLNRPRSADILFDFASPCGEPGVSGRFYALLLRYTSARCTQPTTTFPPRSPSSSSRTSRQSWISISLSSSLLPVSSGLSARCYRGKEQFHPLYPCLTSPIPTTRSCPSPFSRSRVWDGCKLRANTFNPFLLVTRRMHSMTIRGAFRLARGEPRAMIRTA